MAVTLADRPLHKLSVEDVYRMLENGVITEDSPVELLEGVLVEVNAKSPAHVRAVLLIDRWLLPLRDGGEHWVRTEQPLLMPDGTSMPEPDLSVVAASTGLADHPRTALLVVEVSKSSMRIDREVKAPLYASAAIPEYWIVDVEHQRLEVRRDPRAGEYASVETFGRDDTVSALALDLPPLALASIF